MCPLVRGKRRAERGDVPTALQNRRMTQCGGTSPGHLGPEAGQRLTKPLPVIKTPKKKNKKHTHLEINKKKRSKS